jgi:hypothetical protein
MKVSTGNPDAMPPGLRGLSYGIFCWLNRHIVVLRGIGAVLRLWPSFGGRFGLAARASAVKSVLTRPRSFSNRAHAPNLVAGDYLIAMDPGPTYDADRDLLERRLAVLNARAGADREARSRVAELGKLGEKSFDLIDDYLMWIAFRAIQPVFGTAASEVAAGAGGDINDTSLSLPTSVGLNAQYGQPFLEQVLVGLIGGAGIHCDHIVASHQVGRVRAI